MEYKIANVSCRGRSRPIPISFILYAVSIAFSPVNKRIFLPSRRNYRDYLSDIFDVQYYKFLAG